MEVEGNGEGAEAEVTKNVLVEKHEMIQNYTNDPSKVFKDDYEIRKVIGNGVQGVVRECVQRISGEHRAVKIIKRKNLTPQEEESIRNEIDILTGFDHPNLIKFYGAYKDEKRYYIITELCQGGPLLDILTVSSQAYFSEKDALRIMHQLF